MKLGCSSRLGIIIIVALIVLVLFSVVIGAIGASLRHTTPFTAAPVTELPPGILWQVGPVPISNTMVTSWISMAVLIALFVLGTKRMKLVPKGLQNFLEWAVEKFLGLVEDAVGHEKGRLFFPMVGTIFFFVVVNAWMGLIPMYGAFGPKETIEGEATILPILRPANTDLNLTLALAIVSFIFVEYLGVKYNGALSYAKKFFNFGPIFSGFGKLFTGKLKAGISGVVMGIVQAFVGIVEFLSEIIRLLSFSFRLFGNMTAGEILLLIGFFLAPFVVPLFFYSLEFIVGLIQALVFAMLTMVFAATATAEHEH